MSAAQSRDIAESRLVSLSEQELAGWLQRRGYRITVHRGRYWNEMLPGFFRPANWAARLEDEQATSPSWRCWGFRAALRDPAPANGSLPAHVFADLPGFTPESLGSMQARNYKKSRKQVEMIVLTGPELLLREGYEVVADSFARTSYSRLPSREAYLADIQRTFEPGRLLVLAGLVEGKLAGYITAYAADGIAYVDQVHTRSEAMRTGINTGLLVEFLLCCRRSEGIREIIHGLDTPENPSLVEFKRGFGFPIVQIPTRIRINPVVDAIVRARYPERYYRLTGRR